MSRVTSVIKTQNKKAKSSSLVHGIIYYLSLPLIYFLSVLPFRLLYLVSDGLFILLFRVTGYRKKVVLQNLRNSFPEKSEAELEAICRKFYHHLCDFFLETVKMLTISKSRLL